jgi:hypothetical protein
MEQRGNPRLITSGKRRKKLMDYVIGAHRVDGALRAPRSTAVAVLELFS